MATRTLPWLMLWFALSAAQIIPVPVRPVSSVSSDVASIEHDISNRQFRINLNVDRKCVSPTFILRLSGAALYKLDLAVSISPSRSYTYGYPALADAGQYHLDAIVLFCGTYNPNNQTNLCMEDASNGQNVINEPYSFNVSAADVSADAQAQPRWRNIGDHVLVPTRYQMHITEARSKGLTCAAMYNKDYCITDRSIARTYASYSWTDTRKRQWLSIAHTVKTDVASLSSLPTRGRGRPQQVNIKGRVNICFVGDSHSRELFYVAQRRFGRSRLVTYTFVATTFPLLFSADQLQRNMCSVAVMCFGQWPLSQFAESPVTIDAIRSEFQAAFVEAKKATARVFFRSENYNGLGAHIRLCPHQDHRTPPAFDVLNNAVRELCSETKGRVPFIDLSAVIGPMWDAAVDFCHPDAPVLHAEVEVILHTVFSHLRDHHLTVQTYAPELLGTTVPGRSQSSTVVERMFHQEKVLQAAQMRNIALERYGTVPPRAPAHR